MRKMVPGMMLRKIAVAAVLTGLFVASAFSVANAVEARPWLCRSKPVFSSSKPMTYEARGSSRWVLSFMRCNANSQSNYGGGCSEQSSGGENGFAVVSTRTLSGHTVGTLEPGQWYAVALYRSGGRWICAGYAGESDEPAPGVVSDLCYSEHDEEGSPCGVKLTVRPSPSAH
jgi:hypothetical protein